MKDNSTSPTPPSTAPSLPWVCPACHSTLSETTPDSLECLRCKTTYPIHNRIPVLVGAPQPHLDEMQENIKSNPAWYKSSQLEWYDRGPCRHHLSRRRSYVESVLRKWLSKNPDAKRLLDLGCGDGANTRWLANLVNETHACDYNMLRLMRCQTLMEGQVPLCLANVHCLPYPNQHFDIVFFNHVLEHIPDDEHALRSVYRILRPGGLLILGVPNEGAAWWKLAYKLQPHLLSQSDHVHFYTVPELEEKVRAVGFDLLEILPTGWGPPHWTLDEKLRKHTFLDDTFEWIGKRFAPHQAASLYLVLSRPIEQSKHRGQAEIMLFDPDMKQEWDDLADRSPQAWLFHKRDFIDLANSSQNLHETSLVAMKNGKMVAMLPLNYPKLAHSRKMGSLAFGSAGLVLNPSLGPHEAESISDLLMNRALRLARQEQCKALEIALPAMARAQVANTHGVSPLDAHGFSATSTSTYILDLCLPEETLFANLRSVARQLIKKAEKEGVTIRLADRPQDIDAYYRIHCQTYERTGTKPHPREYFAGIFQTLVPAGYATIWVAELNDEPIAFANIAHYKNGALFWTGCGTEEALRMGANYLLQWHAIRMAKASGAQYYEIGEAFPGHRGDKLAGLNTFKSAFGGDRWPYHKGRIDIFYSRKPSRLRKSLYYLKESLKALVAKS